VAALTQELESLRSTQSEREVSHLVSSNVSFCLSLSSHFHLVSSLISISSAILISFMLYHLFILFHLISFLSFPSHQLISFHLTTQTSSHPSHHTSHHHLIIPFHIIISILSTHLMSTQPHLHLALHLVRNLLDLALHLIRISISFRTNQSHHLHLYLVHSNSSPSHLISSQGENGQNSGGFCTGETVDVDQRFQNCRTHSEGECLFFFFVSFCVFVC